MLLLLASLAQPCTPVGGFSRITEENVPVGALGVLDGMGIQGVRVFSTDGNELPINVRKYRYNTNGTFDEYRVLYAPEGEWPAGSAWDVEVRWWEYGEEFFTTKPMTIAADGHRVTPVSGIPDVDVRAAWPAGDGYSWTTCDHYDPYNYEIAIFPASADPDGLSWMILERSDGTYNQILSIPADGSTMEMTIVVPYEPDHCFRVIQVDGAGGFSDPSPWRCQSTPDSGSCAVVPRTDIPAIAMALALLFQVRRRR